MRYLLYTKEGTIKKHPLDKPVITIGRDKDNDIVLSDSGVSKKHLCVEVGSQQIHIVDLDSRNHTYVDHNPVKEADISLNHSFGICEYEFFYKQGKQQQI